MRMVVLKVEIMMNKIFKFVCCANQIKAGKSHLRQGQFFTDRGHQGRDDFRWPSCLLDHPVFMLFTSLLAPTGALIGIVCWERSANFFRF